MGKESAFRVIIGFVVVSFFATWCLHLVLKAMVIATSSDVDIAEKLQRSRDVDSEVVVTKHKSVRLMTIIHDGHEFVACSPDAPLEYKSVSIIHHPGCKCLESR